MAIRSVAQLKPGERLREEVRTPLGGMLFPKGRVLNEREIEILHAFLVKSVNIDSDEKDDVVEVHPDGDATESVPPLFSEYDKMFRLLKKAFANAAADSGLSLPLLDIRSQLNALIRLAPQYHVLTFRPPNIKVEDYYIHNSILVAMTSFLLAGWHGYPSKDLFPIALAGLLHDIGNTKIDPDILFKKSRLTSGELEEVKQHTVLGYQMLKQVAGLNEGVKLTALQHHEKEDGSGYPLGVKGEKIHPYAKVVAVADIYHAMTSQRNYKNAESPYLVLEQLFNESFGQLDPGLVQTFIHRVTQFHNGTLVRLNDESVGEIVFTDRNHPTRPWVKVKGNIINLAADRSLHIVEVMKK